MNLNEYAEKINETSTAHGFWPEEGRNMGEMLMLAVSELAEALEEHRAGRPNHYYTINIKEDTVIPDEARVILDKLRDNMDVRNMGAAEPIHTITEDDERKLVELGLAKPEGVAVELADCIIRCLDMMQSLGVDIDQIVQEKMAYNKSRPHKHGKAY